MDEKVFIIVNRLFEAGKDASKQVRSLLELGDWYSDKAKATKQGSDFTKANVLYNAALVRQQKTDDHEDTLRRITSVYRDFLQAFTSADFISPDEIENEILAHKQFLIKERRCIEERLNNIDSHFNSIEQTDEAFSIHAKKMHQIFRDIQEMYIRLVGGLVKECEGRLGKAPCDYAIIAMGSVARMEATPFSDLEFAVLYSDPGIGDKISYFRDLTHFLHMKVINLGETIVPSVGIEYLNDFQSSDSRNDWFYDSHTPRGISFDGAMPWASKTALGRAATKDKPALELIRTPEKMAELQDESIALKEGYHLADILTRVSLLYGEKALIDEYKERVAEKLNAKSELANHSKSVGFVRGMKQMALDVATYHPSYSYLGNYCVVGALFDVKTQFYRLVSLLLSDLGLIFDIRCPSPWEVISALQRRRIFTDTENIRVCLSIANEIRLKTYFCNKGQKELLSALPNARSAAKNEEGPPIFRYFNEDTLIRLLSISTDMHQRCHEFSLKYFQRDEIDVSIFQNPVASFSKANLLGALYYRLRNFPKALECMKCVSTESRDYSTSLNNQGIVYLATGKFAKSVECFEHALEVLDKNEDKYEESSNPVFAYLSNLVLALLRVGQYEKARCRAKEAIEKHKEFFGENFVSVTLCHLYHNLGSVYHGLRDMRSAIETFHDVEKMHTNPAVEIPDFDVMRLNLSIASSLSELGEHAKALEYVKQALHISEKFFGDEDLSPSLAKTYLVAGTVFEHCNKSDEALSWYKRSLEIFQIAFEGKPHGGKRAIFNNLGNFFSRRCQTDRGVEYLEIALSEARAVFQGKPRSILATMLSNLGVALKRAGKSEESLPYFEEAKETMERIFGEDHAHPITSDVLNNMGTVYQDLGDLQKARQCYAKVLEMNSRIYGCDGGHDAMATVYSNIACVAEELGDLVQAKEYYTKAVDTDRKISSSKNTSPGLVSSLYGLCSVCEVLDEEEEALKHLEEARNVAKSAGSKDVMVATVLLELGMKYQEKGSSDEAKICFEEAREIARSLAKDGCDSPSVMELQQLLGDFEEQSA